jgi:hypothetical protein
MKIKAKTKLLMIALALVMAIPIATVGCQEREEPQVKAPPAGALSSTLVPNMDLDVYLYIKQGSPTTLPAEMINAPLDIDVEALAIWGVSNEDDFAFGGALALTSASQATKVYSQIKPRSDVWSKLSGSTIFVVQGSGTAAESLKQAISNNDFKYYDDSKGLKAVATLPGGGTNKLAGVAVARPSKALISYIARGGDAEGLGMVNTMLTLVRLEVIAAGLYSPGQIDVARVAIAMEREGGIPNLDLGILVLLKSGLPGFVVEPAVKKFLSEAEFTERSLGELTLYQGSFDTGQGQAIPVLVRIEGNYVFAAISGKESYAQTLITSINK